MEEQQFPVASSLSPAAAPQAWEAGRSPGTGENFTGLDGPDAQARTRPLETLEGQRRGAQRRNCCLNVPWGPLEKGCPQPQSRPGKLQGLFRAQWEASVS